MLKNQATGSGEESDAKLVIDRSMCEGDEELTSDDDDSSNENRCSICLTEYADGEEISLSHNRLCKHLFHTSCISEWLLTHDECPCCRNEYLSFSDVEASAGVRAAACARIRGDFVAAD